MIAQASIVPKNQTVQTDICIVGTGAAGLTLALEFIDQGFTVCLLETGVMKPKKRATSLSLGDNIGLPYRPLEYVRSRCFGGTTNLWHGACEELDELDFQARPWVPYSGWPFTKSHLQPFYVRARALCQLDPSAYEERSERSLKSALPLNGNRVIQRIRYRSTSPRLGKVYRQEIQNASNITVFTDATAVELITNDEGDEITHVRAASLDGHEFLVASPLFILAAGGIENPRLLLTSNRIHEEGLGNQHDLVGRFFMTHPVLDCSILFPFSKSFSTDWHRYHRANLRYPKATIGLSQDAQFKEKLLNLNTTLHAGYKELQSDGVASLFFLFKELYMVHWSYVPNTIHQHWRRVITGLFSIMRYGLKMVVKPYSLVKKIEAFYLTNYLESAPHPDSRVVLSTDRDELGMNRVKLDWRLSPLDKMSLRRSHEVLGKEIASAGVGRLLIQLDKNDHSWPPTLIGAAHHIGTTRMHTDPRKGVVDQNCKVHGISNLYIAGSSVFPTSGAVSPTLTIVALALRLADHIKGLMKYGSSIGSGKTKHLRKRHIQS